MCDLLCRIVSWNIGEERAIIERAVFFGQPLYHNPLPALNHMAEYSEEGYRGDNTPNFDAIIFQGTIVSEPQEGPGDKRAEHHISE